jgi:hypothetical protein
MASRTWYTVKYLLVWKIGKPAILYCSDNYRTGCYLFHGISMLILKQHVVCLAGCIVLN